MSLTLYELSSELRAVLDGLTEGEVTNEAEEALDRIGGSIEQKAGAIASLIDELDGEREAVGKVAKRLTDRTRALAAKKERLRDYLTRSLDLAGVQSVKTDTHRLRLVETPAKVVIDEAALDWEELGPRFLRIKQELDKRELKSALESGETFRGAHLERGKTVRIS